MIKWRDAYTYTKTTLPEVRKDLGQTAICSTHGKVVHKDDTYTIIEYHKSSHNQNDYFVIPTSLIIQ